MSRSRGHVRVGCSGWVYRDWRGPVYPPELPQRRWFERYAELFDTVEINNTFYRLPPPETVEQWEAQAPPGFLFSPKIGQFGSHRMKLRDAARWLPNHLDRPPQVRGGDGQELVEALGVALPPGRKVHQRWSQALAEALDPIEMVR